MYDRIGKKIKALAETLMYIGMALSLLGGIIMMCISEHLIFPGLLVMGFGCLGAWLGNLLLYGFGELIDKTCDIHEELHTIKNSLKAMQTAEVPETKPEPEPQSEPQPVWDGSSRGETQVLSDTTPMPQPDVDPRSHVINPIFCKRCGTKYDLNLSVYCPICGCENRK